jgi:hypothetical protein
MIRRVVYRAAVLTERWLHRNAFLVGALAGCTLTLLVLLAH